jgi:hypothetical protein
MTLNSLSTCQQLLFLEMNEVNFDFVVRYVKAGRLPAFGKMLADFGYVRTESEQSYDHLEPWIQWVTAHTGKRYAEHGVFRLGDIVTQDIAQIWEVLEQQGLLVGAISPMNAKNCLRRPAFFVPDPWTKTTVSASPVLLKLYGAIAQAVNDNSSARITLRSALSILRGFLAFSSMRNWPDYVSLVATAKACPWRKAIFLDLLLADIYCSEVARARPHFATLFLNAAAHIQHHYLFNSAIYVGSRKNPKWYVDPKYDPVFEVYDAYDRILASIMNRWPASRIMIGTALHQDAHESSTFYWRLADHAAFLRRIGMQFVTVHPRMSRDFLVVFQDVQTAATGERMLRSVVSSGGDALFEVDNRGNEVFVTLVYSHDVGPNFTFLVGKDAYPDLKSHLAFVAVKNGEHSGIGYFVDTGARFLSSSASVPLESIPDRICKALLGEDADWQALVAGAQPTIR